MANQMSFLHVSNARACGALWLSEALITRLLFYTETSDQSQAAWQHYDLCIAKFQRAILIKVMSHNEGILTLL